MLTICLKDLKFRAFHGVYNEERVLGGDFLVNLEVGTEPEKAVIRHLEETLNYENLYLLVRKAMEIPSMLIETVAMEVATDLLETFPTIKRVWISIEKCNPPIEKMEGSVKVVYEALRG